MSQFNRRVGSRKKPSVKQERRFLQIVVFIAACTVLWLIFAPGSGFLALYNKKQAEYRLEKEIDQLKQENAELQHNIEQLQNDPQHLEEVARREYGLLKKNERVFSFPERTKSKKE